MYIYTHSTHILSICSLKAKQSVVLVHTHRVAQHCWTASNAFAFSVQMFSSLQSHGVGKWCCGDLRILSAPRRGWNAGECIDPQAEEP